MKRVHCAGIVIVGAAFGLIASLLYVQAGSGGQLTRAKSQTVGGTPKIDEIVKPFSIGEKGREAVEFEVRGAGRIEARAEWTGEAGTLSLILNGPGQTGYYARQNGKSPLSLSFKVTDVHVSRGKKWTLSVANFGAGSARGKVVIKIPVASAEPAQGTGASGKTAVKQTVQRPSRQAGTAQSVEKSIKVLWPNGGEELVIGKTYTFRWESKGVRKVICSLRGSSGGEGLGDKPASGGAGAFRIWRGFEAGHGYALWIYDFNDNKINDASDAAFSLVLPPVDLVISVSKPQEYYDRQQERRYIVKVKNAGTKVLQDVVVEWVLKKLGTMVKQDGWGFGEMFPGTLYENRIVFKRVSDKDRWTDYSWSFFVDPSNQQNEDEELRDDNAVERKENKYGN
jgi:hypothetical protein